jgi:hypothetical protein
MLPKTVGHLYVGGLDVPFAQMKVNKVSVTKQGYNRVGCQEATVSHLFCRVCLLLYGPVVLPKFLIFAFYCRQLDKSESPKIAL